MCYPMGPTGTHSLQDAMRNCNVADIPAIDDSGRCELVISIISKALTDKRSQVKNVVSACS